MRRQSIQAALVSLGLFAALAMLPAQAQFSNANKPVRTTTPQEAIAMNETFRQQMQDGLSQCADKEAEACHLVGDLYRKGFGVMQDYSKAAQYYRKSCNLGSARGCAGLAYLYNRGSGMDAPDFAQARLYFKKSCDLGEVSGCAGYGNLLFVGKGGRKDTATATRYLQEACDQDYEWACQRIRDLGAYEREPNWKDTWFGRWTGRR